MGSGKKIGTSKEFIEVYDSVNPGVLVEEKNTKNILPEYSTPLIKIMYEVIEEYWEGKDPQSVITRETMISDLMKKYNISKGDASAIDSITRDPGRRGKG